VLEETPINVLMIGAKALLKWFPDAMPTQHTDVIVTKEDVPRLAEIVGGTVREIPGYRTEIVLFHSKIVVYNEPHHLKLLSEFWELAKPGDDWYSGADMRLARPEWLYALKLSHRFSRNHDNFVRTRLDLDFLKANDRVFILNAGELAWLKDATAANENPPFSKLLPQFGMFYKEHQSHSVEYSHASIHEVYRHTDVPMYTKVSEGGWYNIEKWITLSREEQLLFVLEEVYVASTEYIQIPTKYAAKPRESALAALEFIATSATPNWIRNFAWDNYFKIRSMIDPKYLLKFQEARLAGRLEPHESLRSESDTAQANEETIRGAACGSPTL